MDSRFESLAWQDSAELVPAEDTGVPAKVPPDVDHESEPIESNQLTASEWLELGLYMKDKDDFRHRMVAWAYLDFIIYFELFLQVIMELRHRTVTWIYLDFIIYFELFLQGKLDLWCRMVTWVYLEFIIWNFS